MVSGFIVALERYLHSLRINPYAQSSLKTRRNQWQQFEVFCARYNLCSLPATEKTLCPFIAHLAKSLEYTTIVNYAVGVVSYHHFHDKKAPELQHFAVKQALAGMQHARTELPNRRNAVTLERLDVLGRSLHVLPKNVRKMMWVACLTAFFFLLRRANLFETNRSGSTTHLRVEDVSFQTDVTALDVAVLKSNRYSGSRITILLSLLLESKYCPTFAIRRMLESVSPCKTDALFSVPCNNSVKALSDRTFNSYLKQVLDTLGVDGRNWSAHLFRRDGTTFATAIGLSDAPIKAQENWRTNCFQRYISVNHPLRAEFVDTIRTYFKTIATASK